MKKSSGPIFSESIAYAEDTERDTLQDYPAHFACKRRAFYVFLCMDVPERTFSKRIDSYQVRK
jgi:hypothetical protein